MRNIRTAFIALAAVGTAALTASAANAQAYQAYYGYYGPRHGSYYGYGADRANPSVAPNGWDQDNPRDQQLQGTR